MQVVQQSEEIEWSCHFKGLTYSHDATKLAASTYDEQDGCKGAVYIFNSDTLQVERKIEIRGVNTLCFSRDDKFLIVGINPSTFSKLTEPEINFIDTTSGQVVYKEQFSSSSILDIVVDKNFNRFCVGDRAANIQAFQIED